MKWIVLVATLCAIVTPAAAQGQLPVASRLTTPGGVSVLHAPVPGAERTVIQFLWRDAASISNPALSWLQALAPANLADGPANETKGAYSERLKDIGAGYNWSVSSLGLQFSISVREKELSAGAEAIAAMLAMPRFSESRFDEVRGRVTQTWQQNLAEAEPQANVIAARLQGGRAPVIGVRAMDLATLKRGDLAALIGWRKQVMGRTNLVVTAAGPSATGDVARAVDTMLASVPAGGPASAVADAPMEAMPRSVHLARSSAQTVILLTAPMRIEPGLESALQRMAFELLSGGFNSRLYRAVREGLGAAYGVRAETIILGRRERLLVLRAPVDHARARAAHEAMVVEYDRFWRDGATEAELAALKQAARLLFAELARNTGQMAMQLTASAAEGLPDDGLQRLPAAIEALTLAEFNAFIRARLPAPPLGLVIVGPAETAPKADCVITALADLATCGK